MAASEYFREVSSMYVYNELQRQTLKWGEQNHSQADWFIILGEEVGEVAGEEGSGGRGEGLGAKGLDGHARPRAHVGRARAHKVRPRRAGDVGEG
mgnify:CR=1 FL=1